MRIMETITNKPNWEGKVFNDEITARWREEIQGGDNTEEYKKTGMLKSYDSGVVEPDSVTPREIQEKLWDLAKSLEQESPKDYHPNSDNKVVDLRLIGADDCFLNVGLGETTKVPDLPGNHEMYHNAYSNQFHGECQIASYVNNLHPAKHRDLYRVIEQVLTWAVPPWNKTLTMKDPLARIPYNKVEYLEPEPEVTSNESGDDEFWDLQTHYAEKGLQVIVKLANIELAPENPNYEARTSPITLSFRHRANESFFDDFNYEQDQFQFLRMFGFSPAAARGVTCREGRLLKFPNTLQHCPGHRKILAFFLIDAARRIISTAHVPPRREDRCTEWEDAMDKTVRQQLPAELQRMLMSDVDFTPMTMDEAKEYRVKLMRERGDKATKAKKVFEQGVFNLCEH
ncbi:hypothetical protein BDW62DRAFT_213788 [Aspergillus aurantiobrunneus]